MRIFTDLFLLSIFSNGGKINKSFRFNGRPVDSFYAKHYEQKQQIKCYFYQDPAFFLQRQDLKIVRDRCFFLEIKRQKRSKTQQILLLVQFNISCLQINDYSFYKKRIISLLILAKRIYFRCHSLQQKERMSINHYKVQNLQIKSLKDIKVRQSTSDSNLILTNLDQYLKDKLYKQHSNVHQNLQINQESSFWTKVFWLCQNKKQNHPIYVHLFKIHKNDIQAHLFNSVYLSIRFISNSNQSQAVIIQIMTELIIEQKNPKLENPPPSFKQKLMKYKKPFLITGIVMAVIVTSTLLFYFLFLIPHITVVNTSTINMPDSSQFTMITVRVKDRNIYEDNFDQIFFVTYPDEQRKSRLLQKGNSQFYVHALNQQIGINIRMSPQSSTSFFVNQDTFINYAQKQPDDNSNSTKEPEKELKDNSNLASNQQFFVELGNTFTQAAEKAGSPNAEVKFVNQVMANIKLNKGFLEFQTSSSKRNLIETKRKLFFLKKILSVAKAIVPKVASFLVGTIRKYGPVIGKVVGGVVGGVGGFMVGGPAGAFQGAMTGMQIGGMIGGAASSLVNACIPQGTLRISCTPGSLGSVMGQFGSSSGGTQLFPQGFGGGGLQNLGNIAGNFLNNIPKQALSNFGFGSVFGKLLRV